MSGNAFESAARQFEIAGYGKLCWAVPSGRSAYLQTVDGDTVLTIINGGLPELTYVAVGVSPEWLR